MSPKKESQIPANKYIHKEHYEKEEKTFKKRKPSSVGKFMHTILDGTILTRKRFLKSLPFTFYLVFLMIIYIANNFNTEKKLIEINNLNKQLKAFRYEYINSKAKVMQLRHSSAIASRLTVQGIKIPVEQPVKLQLPAKENKNFKK
jgi:hypothetical protein